ncbi:MAG TPA: CobD/CbiB family protein [Casimicrobiaceae bacterium]
MKLIAILAALGLEQWRAFDWRASAERLFRSYAHAIELHINGGTRGQGVLALIAAVAPPAIVVAVAAWLLASIHPLLALVFDIAVLYLLMGFRHFSHALSLIISALRDGDIPAARRALAGWRGASSTDLSGHDVARLAVERGLIDAYRQVFGILFWFVVLPGPVGAVIYRLATLLAADWRASRPGEDPGPLARSLDAFGYPARRFLWLLDWLPARLTALAFAAVGDFEDAIYCWRTQARHWPDALGGGAAGIVLATGAGALGVRLGGPLPGVSGEPELRPDLGVGDVVEPEVLPSAVGLVWRALVLWLLLVLLLLLANWAP